MWPIELWYPGSNGYPLPGRYPTFFPIPDPTRFEKKPTLWTLLVSLNWAPKLELCWRIFHQEGSKMANFGPHNWIIAIIIITIYISSPAPHGGGAGETRRTEQHHHHHHHHHYHHCLANPPEEAVVRVAKPSASRFRPNLSPSNTWPINHCHFLNRMTVQTLIPNHPKPESDQHMANQSLPLLKQDDCTLGQSFIANA